MNALKTCLALVVASPLIILAGITGAVWAVGIHRAQKRIWIGVFDEDLIDAADEANGL